MARLLPNKVIGESYRWLKVQGRRHNDYADDMTYAPNILGYEVPPGAMVLALCQFESVA